MVPRQGVEPPEPPFEFSILGRSESVNFLYLYRPQYSSCNAKSGLCMAPRKWDLLTRSGRSPSPLRKYGFGPHYCCEESFDSVGEGELGCRRLTFEEVALLIDVTAGGELRPQYSNDGIVDCDPVGCGPAHASDLAKHSQLIRPPGPV